MKIYRYLVFILMTSLLLSDYQPVEALKKIEKRNKNTHSDSPELTNFTFKPSIKSVRFHKKNWDLSYPILERSDSEPLVLSFDELGDRSESYSYTITHCDHLWRPTQVIKSDYLDGLQEQVIQDFEFSRNTHQDYVHYNLEIPNEDMKLKLSGNYVLTVFQNYDQEDVVLTRRFYYADHKVDISGRADRSTDLNLFYTHQEVDFKILHPNLVVDDPSYNINVVVLQNLDWSTAKTDLTPSFTGVGELIYDFEEQNQFQGLSEFRHFDIKNLNYVTEGIDYIQFERPLNHVYLLPDQINTSGDYYFEQDINGKYLITYHLDFDPNTGADYVMVHFRLPFETAITGGDVYVYGGLSDWSFAPSFKMNYNSEDREYQLAVLLKQGYYNYQYRYIPEGYQSDPGFIESSHYETENDYIILVYYKDFSSRYEQLVGYQILNNINKNQE